jgi:hypothetical protein
VNRKPAFGLFPGQRAVLRRMMKKADKFDHFRQRSRRAALLGLAGAALACAGSFWSGLSVGQSGERRAPAPREDDQRVGDKPVDDKHPSSEVAPTPERDMLAWLHALAIGPLEDLELREMHVLRAAEQSPADERLAYAVQRLTVLSLRKPDNQTLRARLLRLHAQRVMPEHVQSSLQLLDARR